MENLSHVYLLLQDPTKAKIKVCNGDYRSVMERYIYV